MYVCVCVCMYVLIDGVTAGCQAYLQPPPPSLSPSAPTRLSNHSVPSSFNLAAETKESSNDSHRGTLLIFKHPTHDSFSLSHHLVSLLCPHLSPPPLLPPPCNFVLGFNFPASLPSPHSERRIVQTSAMQDTLSILFCVPFFFFFV